MKDHWWGVPTVVQWDWQCLRSTGTQVRYPAPHNGLGSGAATAAASVGSDPWPGNSICHRAAKNEKKKNKKKQLNTKKPHWSPWQIKMKKLEMLWEKLNVMQRDKVSKYCWKNSTNRLVWCGVAKTLLFVKLQCFLWSTIKAKGNKMRSACMC